MKSFVKCISTYVPSSKVSNDDIASRFLDWDSDKITSKIGIEERHIAGADETVSDMATTVIKQLFQDCGVDKRDVDYLIICTQSPDYKLPTTACIVQHRVGLSTSCAAVDINQGCSGYIYGLSLAASLVSSGNFKNVLLVTADTYSKIIHPEDKGNISLFGDAATATLISTEGRYEIGAFSLGSDGSGADHLILRNGGVVNHRTEEQNNVDNYLFMNGGEVFNFTAKYVPNLVVSNLTKNGLQQSDVDLFVFHQANTFMLNFLRKRIGIAEEKFLLNMAHYGNTVSSSIPLAFNITFEKPLRNVMLVGFGVGFSWGAVVIKGQND